MIDYASAVEESEIDLIEQQGREMTEKPVKYERVLDCIEESHVGYAPAWVMEYEGSFDPLAMKCAFEHVLTKYPVLNTHIISRGGKYLLRWNSTLIPRYFIHQDTEHGYDRERTVDSILSKPWDVSAGVSEIHVVSGVAGGLVLFRRDHSISDGPLNVAILTDLWKFYSDIVKGCNVEIEAGKALPRGPYELYKDRWGDQEKNTVCEELEMEQRSPIRGKSIFVRIILDKRETEYLKEGAHRAGTTVYSIACGCIAASLRDHDLSCTEPARMMVISNVGLRKLVSPIVGVVDTTTFATIHVADLQVAAGADPTEIGKEVKRQLNSAIADKRLVPMDRYQTLPRTPVTQLDPRLSVAMITTATGGIEFATQNDLTLRDCWIAFPKSGDKYGDYSSTVPGFIVLNINGNLSIQCVFPSTLFSSEDIDEIASRIRKYLVNV